MSDDPLTRPLGQPSRARSAVRPVRRLLGQPPGRIVAAAACGGLVLTAGLATLLGDPHGGQPRARVDIALREPDTAARPPAESAREAASPQRTAVEVEAASGVTVVRPAGTAAPDAPVLIRVPNEGPARLAAAPDPRLVERGRHGPLPRLGEGRLRSLDLYAKPDPGSTDGPRIAILVSGLGIGQAATAAAITKLPAAVSLAFAPYGSDLERAAGRAREAGHEILLQAPMEPFDYPDSDPGPQTLLTSARPAENLDRLAWAMSRFPGFVGVATYMGAKLTSDAGALEPILREIGARGLGFVDDGASPRSLALTVAAKSRTPVARADLVIDAVPRAETIDRELARLETLARQKGLVLASASALPLTIDRLARWSQALETRGIRLVPVSTILRASGTGTRLSSATP